MSQRITVMALRGNASPSGLGLPKPAWVRPVNGTWYFVHVVLGVSCMPGWS
ncbi:MAG TPA: hypothetical protein VLM79_35255 [Kofleriaceae bacterium]|nr:hypothetical protein [Kofleriaceae bacterium]